jgi:hypothetical protein
MIRLTPYNEFFADLVSILVLEKPDVITDALSFNQETKLPRDEKNNLTGNWKFIRKYINKKNPSEAASYRNFSDSRKKVTEADDHGEFFPARQFIWEEYLSKPSILKNKKGEILAATFSAIIKAYYYRKAQGENLRRIPDAQQLEKVNQEFIAFLKQEIDLRLR